MNQYVSDVKVAKQEWREKIWSRMDELQVSRFPGTYGRIPNFDGAEGAARRLADLLEFQRAKVVKVNPDSPQAPVRKLCLSTGKILLMPSPRLRKGFLVLDPEKIPRTALRKASTIRGAFIYGEVFGLEELPRIDLIVAGSVAVSSDGSRIGKGGGYSEIEYGILRELGSINDETPIVTTVHDAQVVDVVPVEDHDLSVDAIITPTRVIETKRRRSRPKGIFWDKVTPTMLEKMPILKELSRRME